MASKIQSHHVYVAITPYKVGDSSAEEFNELDVMTSYDQYHKYFYVCLHAGWKSDYGGHGCIIMGADDPLTSSKWVKVKDSPKNSQKTINEIGAAMELAKDAIAWLFDKRDWQRLYVAVRNIALFGYTEKYRQQMEQLMKVHSGTDPIVHSEQKSNNQNSEDKNMRLNMNANQNESANVQAAAPVNNPTTAPIEDAVAVEITTEADVQEVQDIVPVVTPKKSEGRGKTEEVPQTSDLKPQTSNKPATTMPLGEHGTLVIAGVGGTKKTTDKTDKTDAPADAVGELAGMLTKLTFGTYKTKKGADAPIITGFGGDDDPRWKKLFDAKPKWVSAGYRRDLDGNKTYHLMFGTKYMAVAKALADAYNTTDCKAWEKAEQACADNYNGIVSGYKAEKEARKAEREAKKAEKTNTNRTNDTNQPTAGYSAQDVAAMLQKVLAGGELPKDVESLMKKAA